MENIKQAKYSISEGVDFISSLPDEILQHILAFLSIRYAIPTSLLSRRWRLVWCGTPFVDVQVHTPKLIETLTYYRAPKETTFHLTFKSSHDTPYIDTLIESAISHNVEKLVVEILGNRETTYTIQDVFYVNSSLKKLSVSVYDMMIPRCTVSWKSLETLSLYFVSLSDESIANILSGCPKLESLKLYHCGSVKRLDLRKSPSLKILEIVSTCFVPGPTEIVAPHIHNLRLTTTHKPCTLVDVSSLIEAYLDIDLSHEDVSHEEMYIEEGGFLQNIVLKMLAKLHNIKRLTLTRTVVQILSFAEVRGISFPTLKVSTLIVETVILRYVIPGIARLIQNSPGLKKLVVAHTTDGTYTFSSIPDEDQLDIYYESQRLNLNQCWRSTYEMFPSTTDQLDSYLESQRLNLNQCWRSTYEMFHSTLEIYSMLNCKGATSKVLASFMELVMRNAHGALETIVVQFKDTYRDDDLETMVLQFKDIYGGQRWFEQLLQMPPTLPHRNNVSIVLNRKNYSLVASVSE